MYVARIPSTNAQLGRHVEHDTRSLGYDVLSSPLASFKAWCLARSSSPAKGVVWTRYSPILDQGQLGSCTGNAMTGLLGCAPFSADAKMAAQFNETFAVRLYSAATKIDAFAGAYPPDDTGSSGLAVAKAAKAMGLITKYSHAFTTNALIYALTKAPVIVGVPWYESFFTPDHNGVITIGGKVAGGHEFLVRGYEPYSKMFLADNSWGTGWGQGGSFHFSVDTWNALRKQKSDITAPVR